MKKCYSLLRWPCLLQDVLQQTFTVQNKPAAVAPRKPSPIISSFLEWAEENCRCGKICGGAENVVKAESPANIRKWIARFYYFKRCPRWRARVLTIIA